MNHRYVITVETDVDHADLIVEDVVASMSGRVFGRGSTRVMALKVRRMPRIPPRTVDRIVGGFDQVNLEWKEL